MFPIVDEQSDIVMGFEPNTYERARDFLNEMKDSRLPSENRAGDIFYPCGSGGITLSRTKRTISIRGVDAEIVKNLTKIVGGVN